MKRLKLKQFRIGRDLSQEEMANTLNISRESYALIENGKRRGKEQFWCDLQNSFHIPDADMWELMKRKED